MRSFSPATAVSLRSGTLLPLSSSPLMRMPAPGDSSTALATA
jgi:hypothetical protein